MKLTVLGCAGSFPGPQSGCSSYLVEADGFRLLIDAGNGAVGALQRHGGLGDVDAVVLSHLHADHCIDLVAYAIARHYDPAGSSAAALPVYGPPGTAERITQAADMGQPSWLDDVYAWQTLTAGEFTVGPFAITAALMCHPVECYGLRIEHGGRTLTYSADTGPCPALVELARDADLLLCEASFLDGAPNPPDLHLTGSEAGRAAVDAGARSLLLTHLVSWHAEEPVLAAAAAVYPGELRLARMDLTYDV